MQFLSKLSTCFVPLEFFLGAYAPVTMEGNIMVDGVLASCYALVSNHDLVLLVMKPLR